MVGFLLYMTMRCTKLSLPFAFLLVLWGIRLGRLTLHIALGILPRWSAATSSTSPAAATATTALCELIADRWVGKLNGDGGIANGLQVSCK